MGCTAAWVAGGAAAGIGTYKYIKGELESTEKVSLDKAYQATQTAMEDLEFTITSKQKDAFDGEVIARRATGKKVTVKLKRQSDSVTQIKIRVGTFGDETISKDILDTMKKYF
jgi:L-fucose isomerase-like protein